MEKMWFEFYHSRIGQYLIQSLGHIILYNLIGFEMTVLICLAFMIGDLNINFKILSKGLKEKLP